MQSESFIRILRKTEHNIYLKLKSLDAAELSAGIFDKVRSAILMSGTLLPLQMYADLLGFEESRTLLREYSSIFPK